MVLFLDSGVGGLAYLEEFLRRGNDLPCAYLADTACFPYGERSPESVRDRVIHLVRSWIQQHGGGSREASPSAVVVACNTASVVALQPLRATFPVPFIGVVPAVKPAAGNTRSGSIAVLSTSGTSRDPYTDDLVARFARHDRVIRLGLPRLVDAAERGVCCDDRVIRRVIQEEVAERLDPEVDTVVLACTHFVRYRDVFQELLGGNRTVVDSLEGVTRRLEDILADKDGRPGTRPAQRDTGMGAVGPTRTVTFYHTAPLPDHLRCLTDRYNTQLMTVVPSRVTIP